MLFEKKPADQRRSASILVRVTADEREKIAYAANIRQMGVSEFMRRAALGRKSDVRFETDFILDLREVTQTIRTLHAGYVTVGAVSPEDVLSQ